MYQLLVPFGPVADTPERKDLGEKRDLIDNISLTMKLLSLIQRHPLNLRHINSPTFSWLNPQQFGVPFPSPVPPPLN